jgi:hypothetical protein
MIKFVFLVLVCAVFQLTSAQNSTYVDDNGVFRYSENDDEIRLFGVNYTLPFAHGYRAINYLDKNHKEAIDKDVYHIARLGITAYRVHIWDSEITDEVGNLLNTPQLDLLDYLLAKLKQRGIKTIVTPFKVGGNGYPEKNVPTLGFSDTLEKGETYADEELITKQKRYFIQLLNHINPYTELAYKKDPDIIALEINNEPVHDNGEVATTYINKMVKVIRDTGFENPIFYNVSERAEFVDDYLKADIQGCTFQWYPSGLVHNSEMDINFLPNVDKYQIPFENKTAFQNKTRIIYEFDPADTNSPILFPAMARSFREAKFQFATQFEYDAIDLAYANTEYQTHYLNLVYTPSKAISLKIASEAFQEIENGQSFGRYPNNNRFKNTTLIPEKDLAVYNSDDKFIYTNSTDIEPKAVKKLEQIAGLGKSKVVHYDGNGAYFLDKVSNGNWRLEVMPDVIWVKDPFEKASLNKTVAVVKSNEHAMKVNLEDLGSEFQISGINEGNDYKTTSNSAEFKIQPGTYLLHKKSLNANYNYTQKLGNIILNEYVDFDQKISKTYVVHEPKAYIEEGQDLEISANIVSPDLVNKVEVVLPSGYQTTYNYKLKKTGVFEYQTIVPKDKLFGNSFQYNLVIYTKTDTISFPNHVQGSPADWDFVSSTQYRTQLLESEPKAIIFDANSFDFKNMLWPNWQAGVRYKIEKQTFKDPSENALNISTETLDAKISDLTFKIIIEEKIELEQNNFKKFSKIVLKASSGDKNSQKVQIALQLSNAQVFGKLINVEKGAEVIEIDFDELQQVPMVLLPNAYPGFQPYWFQSQLKSSFDVSKIEAIQISIGPGMEKEELKNKHQLVINKITLE